MLMMDINQILLIIIVILVALIVIVAGYMILHHLINSKREKKFDSIFDPSKLVEEKSLMNVLDEKKNIEYSQNQNTERFVTNAEEIKVVSTPDALSREQKVNPFGVDMTIKTKDDVPVVPTDPSQNQNKFFQ